MQAIEKLVISHFIVSALDAGFTVNSVNDGEVRHLMKPTHAGTAAEALEVVGSVDDSAIYFTSPNGGKRECLCIILGNGVDCLSDMSCGRADWDNLVAAEFQWANRGADVLLGELVDAQALQIETLRTKLTAALAALDTFSAQAIALGSAAFNAAQDVR